jgi:hypothetical protein
VVELVAEVLDGLDALNDRPQRFGWLNRPIKLGDRWRAVGMGPYFGSIPDFGEVEHGGVISEVRDGIPRQSRV